MPEPIQKPYFAVVCSVTDKVEQLSSFGDWFLRTSYFSIPRNVRLARTFLGLPVDSFGLPRDFEEMS